MGSNCTRNGNSIAANKLSNGSVSDSEFQRLNGLTSGVLQTTDKGAASGLCPLNSNSIIPTQYLPSSVNDIIEVSTFANLPVTGESSKICVTLDDHKAYRWSGTSYVEISASLVFGTSQGTAYDGLSGQQNSTNILTKRDILTFGKSIGNSLKLQEDVVTDDILLAGATNVIGITYNELKT